MEGLSKLIASSSFKKLVNQESYNVGISVIKLIRTDTTLDLSQKAEKSAISTEE